MVVSTYSEFKGGAEKFSESEHCSQSPANWSLENEISESMNLTPRSENKRQERCLGLLKKLLDKEMQYHPSLKVIQASTSSNPEMVVSSDRDCAVTSLRCLHTFYSFGPETFATAVNYLDRFISKVRVRTKYLSCVAAGCYFLSCKINEEAEITPTATQLSYIHGGCWKPSDLKRMEGVLLNKLKWDLSSVSCLSFLKVFLDILCILYPSIQISEIFEDLIKEFEVCVSSVRCAQQRPSTLALCLLQSYIETSSFPISLANYNMEQIQKLCQISETEMSECLSLVKNQLLDYHCHPGKLSPCLPMPRSLSNQRLKFKPSLYGDTDLPTIYEDHSESMLGQGERSPFDSREMLPLNTKMCQMKSNSLFSSRHIKTHGKSHIS